MALLYLALQPIVPPALLELCDLILQLIVASLLLTDLADLLRPVARIQLSNKLWNEVRVLRCFLHGWQARARGLALPRTWLQKVTVLLLLRVIVSTAASATPLLFAPCLLFQQPAVKVAERIGAQAAAVELRILFDNWIVDEGLGDIAEGSVVGALGAQMGEEQ